MAAALLAALMSTVSGALNSIATLVSFDLYKQWKPNTSDRKLVLVGQVATVVCMLVAIVWSKYIGQFASVYKGCVDLICYVAPPITTVFVFGVFWKKASNKAAIWTMAAGSLMGLGVFIMDWNDLWGWSTPAMLAGFYLFCICSAIMVVVSVIYPHKHTEESIKLVWKNPLEALRDKGWPGLGNYKFLSVALFATMGVCYLFFLKPGSIASVDPGPTKVGLVCTVYEDSLKTNGADGETKGREIRNFHDFLFLDEKPSQLESSIVANLDKPAGLAADRVYEYRGYLDIPQDGFYQFNVSSAQKVDLRLDNITLSLYDQTRAPDAQVRDFLGQIHLDKGKHEMLLLYYPSVPWKDFVLKDELGAPNQKEIDRKAAWEKEGKLFKLTYLDIENDDTGGKGAPIPGALLSHAGEPDPAAEPVDSAEPVGMGSGRE